MKYDVFAEFAGEWENHRDKHWGMRLALLCEALPDRRKIAQETLKEWILDGKLDTFFRETKTTFGNLISYQLPTLEDFPRGSFTLEFTFFLDNPYLSGDDSPLYILDNPLKKEKIFKLPYISASQWKGNLHSAVREIKNMKKWEDEDEQMRRIFGNIRTEEENENLHQGALRLYPTFFDRISLEVINPHDRETGTGKNPIFLETVPKGTESRFRLLYFPVDYWGKEGNISDAVDDFGTLAEGVHRMMTLHGFGARVSSGFGRVKNIEDGELHMRIGERIGEELGLDKGMDLVLNFESFKDMKNIAHELSMKIGGRK